MNIELRPQEIVLKKAMANYMVHGMTFIGYLWLTNQRIAFYTRPLNFRREALSIELADIAHIELPNILWIFNQGLRITDQSGKKATFSVWNRKTWAAEIESAQEESRQLASV